MTTTLHDIKELAKKAVKKVPEIKAGYTVKVYQKIREGEKQRVQSFEGLVIAVNSGYGADKSFTVRKVVEGIGVEKIFPLYSPLIEKIEVKKKSKVRRAKLYYMRERFGKSARLRESFVSSKDTEKEEKLEAEREKAIEELAEQKAKEEETTDETVATEEETENSDTTETAAEEVQAEKADDESTPEKEKEA